MTVGNVPARAEWEGRLEDELSFWRRALAGETDYLRWRLEQLLSREGRLSKFPVRLLPHLEDFVERHGAAPRILDIGSGPLSTLGWAAERGFADVIAVDPLAERYRALMTEHGYTYPVTPIPGTGEELGSMFEAASFDMVYSRNALDHCVSPHQVLRAAVRVLRPRGVLFLEGAVAEGTQQQWDGLHQHDILPTADDVLHSDRNGAVTSLMNGLGLRRLFSGSGQSAATEASEWKQNDWYVLIFEKLTEPADG